MSTVILFADDDDNHRRVVKSASVSTDLDSDCIYDRAPVAVVKSDSELLRPASASCESVQPLYIASSFCCFLLCSRPLGGGIKR